MERQLVDLRHKIAVDNIIELQRGRPTAAVLLLTDGVTTVDYAVTGSGIDPATADAGYLDFAATVSFTGFRGVALEGEVVLGLAGDLELAGEHLGGLAHVQA